MLAEARPRLGKPLSGEFSGLWRYRIGHKNVDDELFLIPRFKLLELSVIDDYPKNAEYTSLSQFRWK